MLRVRAAAVGPAHGLHARRMGDRAIRGRQGPFTREELDRRPPTTRCSPGVLPRGVSQQPGAPGAGDRRRAADPAECGHRARRGREAHRKDPRGGIPAARRQASKRARRAGHRGQLPADDQGFERDGPHRVRQRRDARPMCCPSVRKSPQGQLNVRVFASGRCRPAAAGQLNNSLPRIAQMKIFQGDNYIDHIFYGEGVLGRARPDVRAQVRSGTRSARSGAASRPRLRRPACRCTCTRTSNTIDAFLDQIEAITRSIRSRTCDGRWPTSTSSTRRTSNA